MQKGGDDEDEEELKEEREAIVGRFQAFLRIRTISAEGPNGSYREAAQFLAAFGREIGLDDVTVVEFCPGKPVVVMKLAGRNAHSPAVLLNGHYDVVPAVADCWSVDPFAAHRDEATGRIYGRGTQDMKSVCMQYLEAVRRLLLRRRRQRSQQAKGEKDEEKQEEEDLLERNVFLTFLPDEEVGGPDGAGALVESAMFREMNVGVALDEGLASPSEAFTVFYAERAPWWFTVHIDGPTGHGSRFVPETAIEKLLRVLNRANDFRKEQEKRLHGGCDHAVAKKLGDVVTVNMTMLKAGVPGPASVGGYALNVIPNEAMAGFDMRIPPDMPLPVAQEIINGWIAEEGVTLTFYSHIDAHSVSAIDGPDSLWWRRFCSAFEDLHLAIEPEVFPAGTDSRYFRRFSPCFGFSPMNHTPILLHDHNEFLDEGVYLRGVRIYEHLIAHLANQPQE